MPAPYNLSLVTNQSGFSGYVTGLNTMSDGWLMLGFWVSVFLISFLGLLLRGNGARESFAAGSTFSMIIAILAWSQMWVSDWILIINLVMVLGSYALLALRE